MTSFGQLIYPKERCWGQRFFPRSENKFAEVGRGSGRAAHDSPPGIWSSHKRLTYRWRPRESKEQLWSCFLSFGNRTLNFHCPYPQRCTEVLKWAWQYSENKVNFDSFHLQNTSADKGFFNERICHSEEKSVSSTKGSLHQNEGFCFCVSEVSKFIGNRDISLIWTKGKKQMIFKIFIYGLYMKIMTTENNGKPPRWSAAFSICVGHSWFHRGEGSADPIYGEELSFPRLPQVTSRFSS